MFWAFDAQLHQFGTSVEHLIESVDAIDDGVDRGGEFLRLGLGLASLWRRFADGGQGIAPAHIGHEFRAEGKARLGVYGASACTCGVAAFKRICGGHFGQHQGIGHDKT